MRFSPILLLLLLLLGQCAPKTDAPKALPGRPVPTAWIEKLRRYQYQTDNLDLLQEFEGIIAPDTLDGTHDLPHKVTVAAPEPGVLGFQFVNLDADPAEELIGVFGYHPHNPLLAVFKEIDHSWRLLYTEALDTHDNPAELQVGNTFSAHKPFYVRAVLGWGSGVYFSQYQFYKLIDNQVYPCLKLADRTFNQGWEMTTELTTKLQFNATTADEIQVTFAYRFTPGYQLGLAPAETQGVVCVQNDPILSYHWNHSARRYEPDLPLASPETRTLLDSTELSPAKLAYFRNTDNDALFLRAFGYELRQLRREGSPQQKAWLKAYLAAIRRDQARATRKPH